MYPNRPPSPRRGSLGTADASSCLHTAPEAAPAVAAYKPYRPPNSSGSLARLMQREKELSSQVPVGKVKKDSAATTGAAKFVPNVAKQRVIPGMAPVSAQPAKKPVSAVVKTAAAPPARAAAVVAAPVPAVPAAVDKNKKAKAIQKKLKAIEEIRAKQAAGQAVDAEQVRELVPFGMLKGTKDNCVGLCIGEEADLRSSITSRAS